MRQETIRLSSTMTGHTSLTTRTLDMTVKMWKIPTVLPPDLTTKQTTPAMPIETSQHSHVYDRFPSSKCDNYGYGYGYDTAKRQVMTPDTLPEDSPSIPPSIQGSWELVNESMPTGTAPPILSPGTSIHVRKGENRISLVVDIGTPTIIAALLLSTPAYDANGNLGVSVATDSPMPETMDQNHQLTKKA